MQRVWSVYLANGQPAKPPSPSPQPSLPLEILVSQLALAVRPVRRQLDPLHARRHEQQQRRARPAHAPLRLLPLHVPQDRHAAHGRRRQGHVAVRQLPAVQVLGEHPVRRDEAQEGQGRDPNPDPQDGRGARGVPGERVAHGGRRRRRLRRRVVRPGSQGPPAVEPLQVGSLRRQPRVFNILPDGSHRDPAHPFRRLDTRRHHPGGQPAGADNLDSGGVAGRAHVADRLVRDPAQQPRVPRRVRVPAVDLLRAPRHPGVHHVQEADVQPRGQNQRAVVARPRAGRPPARAEPAALLRVLQPVHRGDGVADVLRTHAAARVQGPVHPVRAGHPRAVVHGGVRGGACAARGHGRGAPVLEPRHVPLRQGHDAQGVPLEHEQHGRHHGQLRQPTRGAIRERRRVGGDCALALEPPARLHAKRALQPERHLVVCRRRQVRPTRQMICQRTGGCWRPAA